jgi:hypothetical protein
VERGDWAERHKFGIHVYQNKNKEALKQLQQELKLPELYPIIQLCIEDAMDCHGVIGLERRFKEQEIEELRNDLAVSKRELVEIGGGKMQKRKRQPSSVRRCFIQVCMKSTLLSTLVRSVVFRVIHARKMFKS